MFFNKWVFIQIFIMKKKWNNSIWIENATKDIFTTMIDIRKKTITTDYDQSRLHKYLGVCS
jgi:hypothetical protein